MKRYFKIGLFLMAIIFVLASCNDKRRYTKDGFVYEIYGNILNYEGEEKIISIPQKLDDVDIVSFSINDVNAEKLYIPSTIKYIYSCSDNHFNEIYYDGTLKEYCDNVIIDSYLLPSLFFQSDKVYFKNDNGEYYAIGDKLIIPDGVTIVKEVQLALNVKEIVIPKSVIKIEWYAFSDRFDLNFDKVYYDGSLLDWCKIDLTRSLSTLRTKEFYIKINGEYSKIDQLNITSDIKSVGRCQFSLMANLENINIESGVEYIHPDAFYDCSEIKKVSLPSYFKGLTNYIQTHSNRVVEFTYVD